jgi:hypothetical protein
MPLSSPYSPFLNHIEEFWSNIIASVRRVALTADDQLTDRIYDAVKMVNLG